MSSKLTILEKSTEVSTLSSGDLGENVAESDLSPSESIQSRTPTPDFDADLLMHISTTIIVSQGRVPRLQNSSKTTKADLSTNFDDFLHFLLEKSKRKLGNKGAMVTVGDLTVKYNWWSGKTEPKKIPQLYDLEEEDDFESMLNFCEIF